MRHWLFGNQGLPGSSRVKTLEKIIENLTGYFRVLSEWSRREKEPDAGEKAEEG
jgi:hypothetical protein